MMLYMVYNDKGNIHSETGGLPIGLEFHTQAFGYVTNDQVNYMTFYRTTIYNRGNESIDSCVFGQWVDPDLGNYSDDYVECDVPRNLGICYNGDDNDEGVLGYGLNPPSIGINFFEGPRKADGSEIGLTKFVYYNNDWSVNGNPSRAEHFWYYLNGQWKDRAPITYGGNGRGGSDTASYMFPGNTDPAGRAEWTERTAGNAPADRRFMQTAGSFSLAPGAVNRVTIGVVWARATSGGATGSFSLLKQASDKALKLYKNNFEVIDGPMTPLLKITELNKELILTLTGYSNITLKDVENYTGYFKGKCTDPIQYKFQGYKIYQMKDATSANLDNTEEARLVAQCDIQDGRSVIVNEIFDPELNEDIKKIKVNGEDKGIRHSFRVTKDLFSTESDQTLANFKTYYFKVVAYADARNCIQDGEQYVEGRKAVDGDEIKIVAGIPHNPLPHNQGTFLNAGYTDGPFITRIEGMGNGGNTIELTKESLQEAITSPYYAKKVTYEKGKGPLVIRVINPFKVPANTNFILYMKDTSANTKKDESLAGNKTYWALVNTTNGDTTLSEQLLSTPNEQVFEKYGITLSLNQVTSLGNPEDSIDGSNGYIDASMTFADPNFRWLGGIQDEAISGFVPYNWIRSGSNGVGQAVEKGKVINWTTNDMAYTFTAGDKTAFTIIDPRKQYGKILNGTWAPYILAAKATTPSLTYGPGFNIAGVQEASKDNAIVDLMSVNLVLTADKTKWTRCLVLEMGENADLNIGKMAKGNIRWSPSVGKNGKPDGTGRGMSWFPGYAINIETGQRLNIIFGEDSSMPEENGTDMIWNPTKNEFSQNGVNIPAFGGKHHIYIMCAKKYKSSTGTVLFDGPGYDEGASYKALLDVANEGDVPSDLNKRKVYSQFMWVTIPMLADNAYLLTPEQGIVPNEVTVKLRVKRPYASYTSTVDTPLKNAGMPLYSFSTDGFAPSVNNKEAGKKALDMVNVSPNPYYAYSGYEDPKNQLDNRVKIINVPKECVVSIYTQSGFLVRRIRKNDDSKTYVEWDLKNDANVPISSGVYLIHINAGSLGERIIKWFGIMRPSDFDSF